MSLNIPYQVTGEIKVSLRRLIPEQKIAGGKAIKACAEDLLKCSKELVPVDTGTLRDNGRVEKDGDLHYSVIYDVTVADRLKARGKGTDGISEPDFKYGWLQHENLNYHHSIGQALFLEEPFEENKDRYIREIGQALKNSIKRGKWNISAKWSRRGRQ